jgi:2,3-bisphosphoglycerate-dependent phosphoglycerate mutase
MAWRRSYTARPPALEWDDHRCPRFEPRYAGLPPEQLPRTESLADTLARLLPYWQAEIAPAIRAGQRVLIVAHGNSLRALIQHLEATPEADVPAIRVPTGVPIIYTLDRELHPISGQPVS